MIRVGVWLRRAYSGEITVSGFNRDLSRALALLALTMLTTLQATRASADPPSVKLVTAPLVTPAVAWSYYGTSTTHTVGAAAPTTTPPEITELARALGAGRYSTSVYSLAVYEYIRNNIAIDFRFG